MGIYAIFFKNIKCRNMTYGCQNYDYEDGTMVFDLERSTKYIAMAKQ